MTAFEWCCLMHNNIESVLLQWKNNMSLVEVIKIKFHLYVSHAALTEFNSVSAA